MLWEALLKIPGRRKRAAASKVCLPSAAKAASFHHVAFEAVTLESVTLRDWQIGELWSVGG